MALRDCLGKIGLDEFESAILLGREADATESGLAEREAAIAAVETYMQDLKQEFDSISSQVLTSKDFAGETPQTLSKKIEDQAVEAGLTRDAARAYGTTFASWYESKITRLSAEQIQVVDEAVQKLNIVAAVEDVEGSLAQTFFQGEKKFGSFSTQDYTIRLFKDRDLSTVLHESGHFFLEVERTINERFGEALPESIRRDWQEVARWLKLEPGQQVTVEQHEKFARGFEQYLREGRAPSLSLLDVFRRFKAWLTNIYRNASDLGVAITDPVRASFDRMLATDEQIDLVRRSPVFRTDPRITALLTEAERKQYDKQAQSAIEKGKEKLLRRALAERARENKSWWKAERKRVLAEMTDFVNGLRVYRAMHFLRTGQFLDRPTPEGMKPIKLNRNVVSRTFEGTEGIPATMLSKTGEHPDVVADLFGFPSGASMLKAIRHARPIKSLIKEMTDQTMLERHGDILNDGTIEFQALEDLANADRAAQIEFELNVINRQIGQRFTDTRKMLQVRARQILGRKTVEQAVRPSQYYNMEVKASREAGKALAEKNFELAALWKGRQLINHYLFRESTKARKETGKALKRFQKYLKVPPRKKVKMDEEYRQKIVDILSKYNIGPRTIQDQAKQISAFSLKEWMDQKSQEDVAQFIHLTELESADAKTNYRDLTWDEFSGLTDIVDNIASQGTLIRSALVAGKRLTLDSIADNINENVERLIDEGKLKRRVSKLQQRTKAEVRKHRIAEYIANTKRARTLLREVDGFEEFGPVQRFLMRDIDAASIKEVQRIRAEAEKLEKIFVENDLKNISGKGTRQVFEDLKSMTEQGNVFDGQLTKEGLLAIALNWGNTQNRQKLLEGFNWQEDAVINVLQQNLTVKDWKFVQETWDYLNTFKPEIGALERRRTGKTPEWVDPDPFSITTKDGEVVSLQGGYYPIKVENRLADTWGTGFTSNDLEQSLNIQRWSSAQTKRGHVEARTQSKGKPMRLDLNVVTEHLNQVVHDLTMGEPLENAYKIIRNKKTRAAILKVSPQETIEQLELWIKDLAVGAFIADNSFSHLWDHLRAGTSISVMGLSFTTSLVQVTGISHTIADIGPVNTARGFFQAIGYGNPWLANETYNWALSKSNLLKERQTTFHRDIYDALRAAERMGKVKGKIVQAAFWPIVKSQHLMVDIPTWLGAYHKGLKDFNGNEAKAVEFADTALIRTQSSGLMKDLSGFERGTLSPTTRLSPMIRMWTIFYNYFNGKINLAYEKTKQVRSVRDVPKLATQYLMIFWFEAVAAEFLLNRAPDPEDDDNDPLWWHIKMTLRNLASTLVGFREMAAVFEGFEAAPAGLRGLEALPQAVKSLGETALEASEEGLENVNKNRATRDAITAFFLIGKIPGAAQINRALRAKELEEQGEDVELIDYLLGAKPSR